MGLLHLRADVAADLHPFLRLALADHTRRSGHGKPELRTRGRLYQIQLFKDVLERGSGYKIFRYYDADPELVTDEDRALVGDPSPGGGS